MRDVSSKYNTLRTAKAVAKLKVSPSTIQAIKAGKVPKADPIGVARVAGIQAAKNTSLLIPYCHQVPLDFVGVEILVNSESITINTGAKAIWKTGVEMEASVVASAAALTLYDMLKPIDESMEIVSVKLLEKKGGKSNIKETGKGLKAAVVVMSDSVSKGKREDISGKHVVERLKEFRFQVSQYKVLPDDRKFIEKELKTFADKKRIDLIVTTGGTGVGPRDVTPEAVLNIIDRRLEGMEEALHRFGQERLPLAMLSRSVVGLRGKTLIVTLPGSKSGVEDGINALFPGIIHVFKMLKGGGH